MKRKHSPTSKAAEAFIKPFKPNHKQKVLVGLEKLRVGGTFEEIAKSCAMKDAQVWKRLSEMERDGTIFNTGVTRKLSSGLPGTVWQKSGIIDEPKMCVVFTLPDDKPSQQQSLFP
jgi:hypothetical protein